MGSSSRAESRLKRKKRVRRKVRGTAERPRLCVFRSTRHIYAQMIDDVEGKTLVEASTLSREIADEIGNKGGNKEGAAIVGRSIAEKALSKGIHKVVFDRNGFLYCGRVRAVSESARKSGLEF